MDYASWHARLERVAAGSESDIEVAEGALIIAADEYPGLDFGKYLGRLYAMADYVRPKLGIDRDPQNSVRVLNSYRTALAGVERLN